MPSPMEQMFLQLNDVLRAELLPNETVVECVQRLLKIAQDMRNHKAAQVKR